MKVKSPRMRSPLWKIVIVLPLLLLLVPFSLTISTGEPNNSNTDLSATKAAVITCKGMIDDGLYKSIRRRTQIALDEGAEYLIYEIETYGGLLKSGDDISKYFMYLFCEFIL